MEKLLLKPEEAGALLGVGRSKIYALIAAGRLPGVKVGASVRIPLAALHRWVAQQSGQDIEEPLPVGRGGRPSVRS